MAKFTYIYIKNISIDYISFKLNYRYDLCVFYKKDLNLHSKSGIRKKVSFELQELMTIYQQNLSHIQKLQKQTYNKIVKPQSYILSNKIRLNNNYLKIN